MVKHDLRFVMFWVLAILLIIFIMHIRVVDYAWNRAARAIEQKRVEYKVEISSEELDDFIKLYPKLKNFNIGNDDRSINIEEGFSLKKMMTSVWLFYAKWDSQRFYYVKDRILSVMQTLETQHYSQAVINVLSAKKDKASQEMIKLQQERLNAEKIDPKEADLIRSKENELKELLK